MSEIDHQTDDSEPWFDVFFRNADRTQYELVGQLFDPHFDDMFWWSYRIEPHSEEADRRLRNEDIWNRDLFCIQLPGCPEPSITRKTSTFPGLRCTQDFCARKSDRMSFRSSGPFRTEDALTIPKLLMVLALLPIRLFVMPFKFFYAAPEVPAAIAIGMGFWHYTRLPFILCASLMPLAGVAVRWVLDARPRGEPRDATESSS